MLPSGGSITVVLPLRMWSPVNSRPSSTSKRHRWLAAWPGVWITSSVCETVVSPACPIEHELFTVGQRALGCEAAVLARGRCARQTQDGWFFQASGHAQGLQPWRAGRMVGVRVGADDGLDAPIGGAPQPFDVGRVVRARVDHDVAAGRIAHDVAVGARAGHEARVGCGQALHVFEQLHRMLVLPVQAVRDLAVGADQRKFAETAARAPCGGTRRRA